MHYHHSHKNKYFLKKKERAKGFFIFITMPSFKQVESYYGKKESWEQGCSWVIKFSHCLDFGYCRYSIIIFSILNSKWLYKLHAQGKKMCEVNNFSYFFKESQFHLDVFSRRITFPFKCRKAISQRSWRLKSQNFRQPWSHFTKALTLAI